MENVSGRVGDADQALVQAPSPTVSALSGFDPSRKAVSNALREKVARLDKFFGVMSDDGRAARYDRTLLLAAADHIDRLHDALDRIDGVALQERCERGTAWDTACLRIADRLNVYIDCVLSRDATGSDAMQAARTAIATEARRAATGTGAVHDSAAIAQPSSETTHDHR